MMLGYIGAEGRYLCPVFPKGNLINYHLFISLDDHGLKFLELTLEMGKSICL